MRTRATLFPLLFCAACGSSEVGARERPFTMYFVPSVDAETIAVNADAIVEFVQKRVSQELYGEDEGFWIRSAIPTSYIAVVEAFGTGRADFAALNTFSYILARDIKRYDVVPLVRVVRGDGEATYKAQIIARVDSGIETVQDLNGKRFAYTDPASTAGYILPSNFLAQQGVRPGETTFAAKHDNVVIQVYQKRVDAGATYYSPPSVEMVDGRRVETIRDARARVLTQYPDVAEKVKIVAFTMDTPNEPWVIRGNVYDDPAKQERVERAVAKALTDFAATEEGRRALDDLYDVAGLAPVDDSAYDEIRRMVLESEVDLDAAVK